MKLVLLRISSAEHSTLGQLFIDEVPVCFTMEDEHREEKIKGITRIPEGTYKILLRETISPLTQKYRENHTFFTYHLELQNVPNFNYVYLHIGNVDQNSDGCILLGDSLINNQAKVGEHERGFLGNSTQAFKRVYIQIQRALMKKEPVNIEIRNYKP